MKFRLEIECDNDAFAHDLDAEIVRVLRRAAELVRHGVASEYRHPLRDANGNEVGFFVLREEETP